MKNSSMVEKEHQLSGIFEHSRIFYVAPYKVELDFFGFMEGIDQTADFFGELRKGFAGLLQFGEAYGFSYYDAEPFAA